jgi:O-antigen ligase
LATPPAHLSAIQSFEAFFLMLLAPILYQIRFQPDLKKYILRGLAIYPLVSLVCAPLLSLVSDVEFGYLEYGFIPRWHGTGNGMFTAVVCLLAMLSSIILSKHQRGYWKWIFFAYLMLLATGTRSAILCFPLVFIPEALRQYRQYRLTHDRAQAKRAILFGMGIIMIFLVYSPLIFIRSTYCPDCNPVLSLMTAQNNLFLLDTSKFNSSGRFETWGQFIERGMVNPFFGLGVGAGGSDLLSNRYYRTPHNEFLRLFLDGGLVGLFGGILAYGVTFWGAYRLAKPSYKGYVVVLVIIYSVTAFFSNPLSVQEMAVPFWVILGAVVLWDEKI